VGGWVDGWGWGWGGRAEPCFKSCPATGDHNCGGLAVACTRLPWQICQGMHGIHESTPLLVPTPNPSPALALLPPLLSSPAPPASPHPPPPIYTLHPFPFPQPPQATPLLPPPAFLTCCPGSSTSLC
jgi:hypothetical protein